MLPRFLVIGGQKCGTTWLQENLQQHPEIWLPPTKEVHYFDKGNPSLTARLFGTSKRMRKARAHALAKTQALLSGGSLADFNWAMSYWLERRDDDWYARLFPAPHGKLPGEICPGYARLGEPKIAHVRRLIPDAKIVYLIRNPIDRAWSYATQYFTSPRGKGRHGQIEKVPGAILEAFLQQDLHGHSDYLTTIENWERHFPSKQIMLGFFDELEQDPYAFFVKILDFLEIDRSPMIIPATIRENRNRSRGSKLPPQYSSFLAHLHLRRIEELHRKLQSDWTLQWLRQTEQLSRSEPC